MEVVFAKFNRERLPRFQTVTKIVKLDDGSQIAIKEALSEEAKEHIQGMIDFYNLLNSKYPHIKLVEPTFLSEGSISFPIAKGASLEQLLKNALEKNDKEEFFSLLRRFIEYVDSFVNHRQIEFIPCKDFKHILGNWRINELQDVIDVASFDIIFSNLFLEENNIVQIDYEWVFNFPIPRDLIVSRSIIMFFDKFYFLLDNLKLEDVFIALDLNTKFIEYYPKDKAGLLKYVKGNNYYDHDYCLVPQVRKNISYCIEELRFTQRNFLDTQLELSRIKSELSWVSYELGEICKSTSWRLTKPLRLIATMCRKCVHSLKGALKNLIF